MDGAEGPGRIAAVQNRAVNPRSLIEKGQNAACGGERNGGQNLVAIDRPQDAKFAAERADALASARERCGEKNGGQTTLPGISAMCA